jgi:hypothetical protein
MRKLAALIGVATTAVALTGAAPANAHGIYVYRHAYVYPYPYVRAPLRYYYAPVRAYAAGGCATRVVRTFINGYYVARRVTRCY